MCICDRELQTTSYDLEVAMQTDMSVENAVVSRPEDRSLCRLAEPRLIQALQHRAVILVNGFMLVKGVRDVVGLPLYPEGSVGGVFKAGHWYRPLQHDRTRAIEDALDAGETAITLPGVTGWIEKRPLDYSRISLGGSLGVVATRILNEANIHGPDLPLDCPSPLNFRCCYEDLPPAEVYYL